MDFEFTLIVVGDQLVIEVAEALHMAAGHR